jgi:DNA-binding NtrC family response regulator
MQAPTVLVVEDEQELRHLIVEALEREGFVVAQADTGAEATERIRGFAYDGLIVDLGLPDADGMDILEDALGRYPEIRAIVITGFGGIEEAVRAIRRGAVDFLIKPFQVVQPVNVLKTAINERRLRRENAELRAQLQDRFRFDNIVGTSKPMMQVFHLELVAPIQHGADSARRHRQELIASFISTAPQNHPFVAFNAAAIPEVWPRPNSSVM